MFIPIALLSEFPSTDFAGIRTLIGMDPPMIIQSICSEESLLAYLHKEILSNSTSLRTLRYLHHNRIADRSCVLNDADSTPNQSRSTYYKQHT